MIIWCHMALCTPGDFGPVWPLWVPCLSPAPCYTCPVPELLTASGHGNCWRGLFSSMPCPTCIIELASLLSPASFIQAAVCPPGKTAFLSTPEKSGWEQSALTTMSCTPREVRRLSYPSGFLSPCRSPAPLTHGK